MRKRILSIVLTICLIAATLSIGGAPVSAVPIPDPDPILHDLSTGGSIEITGAGPYIIYQTGSDTTTTDKTITIKSDATVYLDGVNILVPKPTGVSDFSRLNPININGAYEVNLHLVDGSVNTLASENGIGGVSDHNPSMTSGSAKAALRVPAEAKLNIYGDTGILNVTGAQAYNNSDGIAHGGGGAGIGGNGGITYSYAYSPNTSEAESSGTINIYGGMINATGGETTGYWGDGGSGIGSGGMRKDGSHAGSGAVIIHDGTVTVTGGNRGSGSSSTSGYAIGGEITINGGHLIARSASSASSGATIRSPLSEQPLIPNSYKWRTIDGSEFFLSSDSIYSYSNTQNYVEISVIPAAYKVEHYKENLNDSYSLANTDNLTGTTATTATAAAKIYVGFSENTTHASRVNSGTINADGSTVLKLYYDRNLYAVTFKNHDGTTINTQSVKYEGSATAPTAPTRTGYTFSGWNEDFSSVTSDIEVTANYTANTDTTYQVQHYKETLAGGFELANTDNLTGTTAASVTATAKIYTGFNENTSHSNRVNSGTINADGSTVLKLYYDRNEYTVTFKNHDGTTINTQSVKYEGSATAPTAPTRTGYTFDGWSTTFNNVTSNITVTTNYTANTGTAYKVEHYQENLNGSYSLANTDNLTGTTATSTTAAAKIYAGFSENTSHSNRVNSGTINADGSTVLKLYYDRNEYTVTFQDHDGATLKTQSVKYEGSATAPTSPTRTGYSFSGWSSTFNNATSNITVTANYTANTGTAYEVEHYKETLAGGYELVNTDSLTGTTATTATAAAKIYTGFNENTSHTSRISSGTINANGSTVLKLYYDRNEYSVRYVNHDGSVMASDEVAYGDFTEAPATPVRAYHSFAGWFTDNDTFMNEWIFAEKQVTAATNLYAKWTKIPQSITHVSIDDQTKVAVDGLSNKINLTETEIENAADIFVFVKADPIQISESLQEKVESEIDRKGLKLLNVFDIGLYKRVTTYEGVSTETSISNEDILGKIIVRIPLTEEQAKKDNLAIAYIDDEGNITIIAGKIISEGEAKYFEFETDHFSTYSLVETSIVNIPVTGEKTDSRMPLGLLALLFAMGVLIVTKSKLTKEEIE